MRWPWSKTRRTPVRADKEALDELERLSREAKRLAGELTSVAVRLRVQQEEVASGHAPAQ